MRSKQKRIIVYTHERTAINLTAYSLYESN